MKGGCVSKLRSPRGSYPTKNVLQESCKIIQDLFQNLAKPYDSQESWMILARSCELQ